MVIKSKQELVSKLMVVTKKGRMACDIALSLSGWDIHKAIERMKISYPSMVIGDSPKENP